MIAIILINFFIQTSRNGIKEKREQSRKGISTSITYVLYTVGFRLRSVVPCECQGGIPEIFAIRSDTVRPYRCVFSCMFLLRCTNPDMLSARTPKPRHLREIYSSPLSPSPPRRIRISLLPNVCS